MTSVALVMIMLILALAGVVLASMYAASLDAAVGHLNTTQAFYVAEGALQYVVAHEFNGDADWSNNVSPTAAYNGNYNQSPYLTLGGGRAWVSYSNQTTSSVDIQMTGRVGAGVRVLREHVVAAGGVPAALQSVQFALGNLSMNGSSGTVNGSATAGGDISIGGGVTVNGTVTPDATVPLPTADFNFYKTHADQVVNDNFTFASGTYGDQVNGYIWYITGNVTIAGNTTIYGTIVTDGNLAVQNPRTNLTFQAVPKNVDGAPGAETMPAVMVKGNIDFSSVNNFTIRGLVYTLGNISLNVDHGLALNGAVVAAGNMSTDVTTGLNLTYDASYVSGLPGFQGQGQGAVAVAVSQWQEMP